VSPDEEVFLLLIPGRFAYHHISNGTFLRIIRPIKNRLYGYKKRVVDTNNSPTPVRKGQPLINTGALTRIMPLIRFQAAQKFSLKPHHRA
jgi:hypothetical protein